MWWLIIGNEELWIDEPGAVDLITQADIPQWLKDGNRYDDDEMMINLRVMIMMMVMMMTIFDN